MTLKELKAKNEAFRARLAAEEEAKKASEKIIRGKRSSLDIYDEAIDNTTEEVLNEVEKVEENTTAEEEAPQKAVAKKKSTSKKKNRAYMVTEDIDSLSK